MPLEIDIDFQEDLGGNLAPFWHRKSIKILQKVDSKRHQNSGRFSNRFLGRLWVRFGRQDGAKTGPRGRQDGQDGPKRPPRRPQEGPKKPIVFLSFRHWPPRAPKGPPGSLQERFLEIFLNFLVDFWTVFGRFFGQFPNQNSSENRSLVLSFLVFSRLV